MLVDETMMKVCDGVQAYLGGGGIVKHVGECAIISAGGQVGVG